MKKLFIIIVAALLFATLSFSTTIYVPQDYPTIQAAVNAAQSGDQIIVSPGTYEHVYATGPDNLDLIGSGIFEPLVCTIDGEDTYRGIEVNGVENWTIEGFEVRNCWDECIVVENCNKVFILNNYLHDCNDYYGSGLEIIRCDNVYVKNNIIVNNCYSSVYIDPVAPPPPYSINVQVINNTIAYCYMIDGLIVGRGDEDFVIKNNIIVYNDEYGVRFWPWVTQTNSILSYNDNYGNGDGSWYNCTPGIGNISADPQFVGGTGAEAYFLQPTSPCIDAGDPDLLDPDSTRSDIGALYYDQGGGGGNVSITLTPYNPPIVIPPSGGSFEFGVLIENDSLGYATFDGWSMLTLPDGQEIGPMILREGLFLPVGGQITRDLSMEIPSLAMSGTYTLTGYVGDYPGNIIDQDSFTFEKEPYDGSDYAAEAEWRLCGWGKDEIFTTPVEFLPASDRLLTISPNPFNPETVVKFELSEGNTVSLAVFDVLGRKAATLAEGALPAGKHEFTWNAGARTSGMYFVVLDVEGEKHIQKCLLLK